MNFDPCYDKLVLIWRQFSGKKASIRYRIGADMSLVISMNMGSMMFFNILKNVITHVPMTVPFCSPVRATYL